MFVEIRISGWNLGNFVAGSILRNIVYRNSEDFDTIAFVAQTAFTSKCVTIRMRSKSFRC